MNAAQHVQAVLAAAGSKKQSKLSDFVLPRPTKDEADAEAATELFAADIAREAGL